MRLTLAIENQTSLPDGGPLSVTITGNRGLDIGRDQYLDWALPDPSRFISGKHCEIRAQNGEYLLYDVSTNGTMLNGADHRLQSPHRLRTGDRLTIGHYIVAVTAETGQGPVETFQPSPGPQPIRNDLWSIDEPVAAPIDPNELRQRSQNRPAHGDWLEHAADVPSPVPSDPWAFPSMPKMPAARDANYDWVSPVVTAPPPVPPQPSVAPAPRPVVSSGASGPWVDDAEKGATQSSRSVHSSFEVPSPKPVLRTASQDQLKTGFGPQAEFPHQSAEASRQSAGLEEFLKAFAASAQIPDQLLDRAHPQDLAKKLGGIVRILVAEMRQLLGARREAKRMARSNSQTVLKVSENNALKFSPTDVEALKIIFGPPQISYLDAERAVAQGFADLKEHQLRTFSAMQQAVRMIIEDLDPANLEKNVPGDSGISAMLGSRKARLWDAYIAKWNSKVERRDNGMIDVFMQYFSDSYDRIDNGR